MRQVNDTIRTEFDYASGNIIRDAMHNAYDRGQAEDTDWHHGKASDALVADLSEAGFLIVPRLAYGKLDAIHEAVRTGNWTGISDRDWRAWTEAVHAGFVSKSTVLGAEVTPTPAGERAIKQAAASPAFTGKLEIIRSSLWRAYGCGEGRGGLGARGGANMAAEVVAELEDNGFQIVRKPKPGSSAERVGFDDIDLPVPSGPSIASELIATWVRGLGDIVEWCEGLLRQRKIVLTVGLSAATSREQDEDLERRLDNLRSIRGVVGAERIAGNGNDLAVEVRFDHHVTTVIVDYAPLDLLPRKAA
ncbi:hypothetical protein [uncultured Methylobacterium sp.]|uniref:hypothetical protein n=1 Tax=uncultured Methylobacterium sp. TaxID=157278 RepID=UPI0035C9A536